MCDLSAMFHLWGDRCAGVAPANGDGRNLALGKCWHGPLLRLSMSGPLPIVSSFGCEFVFRRRWRPALKQDGGRRLLRCLIAGPHVATPCPVRARRVGRPTPWIGTPSPAPAACRVVGMRIFSLCWRWGGVWERRAPLVLRKQLVELEGWAHMSAFPACSLATACGIGPGDLLWWKSPAARAAHMWWRHAGHEPPALVQPLLVLEAWSPPRSAPMFSLRKPLRPCAMAVSIRCGSPAVHLRVFVPPGPRGLPASLFAFVIASVVLVWGALLEIPCRPFAEGVDAGEAVTVSQSCGLG